MAAIEEGTSASGTKAAPGGWSPAVLWGAAGVLALLLRAAYGLGGRGVATIRSGLEPAESAVLFAATIVFVLGEGVLALQRKWVPRVVGRLGELRRRGRPVHRILAPMFAMGLLSAPRGLLLRSWFGVAAIIVAVLVVRMFPEPWRGIVDFAVAAALVWGAGALVVQAVRAFGRGDGNGPGRGLHGSGGV